MKERVLLIGTGLIGGSLALAIKREKDCVIAGYDINKEQAGRAKQLGVIDEVALNLQKEAEAAGLIILASPIEETKKLMRKLAGYHLREDAIITDVCSTKGDIMALANQLWQGKATFIGGHPMAGSHKTGVESAAGHLFENAYYVLTPQEDVPFGKVEALKEWLRGTKANFLVVDYEEHDYVTGVVSHFPHLIAAGLVRLARRHADENPLVSRLAAGGFKDITRIASSNPHMWKGIVKQNSRNLIQLLDEWMLEMAAIRTRLADGNDQELTEFFSQSKEFRDSLPAHSKGAIPSYYDLHVDVIDVPGAVAKITSLLADREISITNLQIMESREGLLGVLRLSFRTEADRSLASVLLQSNHYKTFTAA